MQCERRTFDRVLNWSLGVLLVITLGMGYSAFFHDRHQDPAGLRGHKRVAVMIPTFRRAKTAIDAITFYAKCPAVAEVHVLWQDVESEIPSEFNDVKQQVKPFCSVFVHKFRQNSLNNRFLPVVSSGIDAVLSVDDDIRLACRDLHLSYEVWHASQNSLVGFVPRIHSFYKARDGSVKYIYNCFWKVWFTGEYSMVLTKVAMFHKKFLTLYTNYMPNEIKEHVDLKMNCEDIAFQAMMSNWTGLSPIYIRGHYWDVGSLDGVSTKRSHWSERNECVTDLVRLYGGTSPFVKSHTVIVSTHSRIPALISSSWTEYFATDFISNYWFPSDSD